MLARVKIPKTPFKVPEFLEEVTEEHNLKHNKKPSVNMSSNFILYLTDGKSAHRN